jgi:hypothetical protein
MMSVGLGNILRDAQPDSQVGPSVVGTVLMALFIYLFWSKRMRAQAATPESPMTLDCVIPAAVWSVKNVSDQMVGLMVTEIDIF